MALTLLLGEAFTRLRLPDDLRPYLGEELRQTGIFKPDPKLGAGYQSFDQFRALYANRLAALGSLDSPKPTWAFFGNSFVQAPGMLGDTAQATLPEIRMFYLQRGEPLNLRVAQVTLLLENGFRPQQIIFAVLPVDTAELGRQPFASILVTSGGALTYQTRLSGICWTDLLFRNSRLAMLGGVRSGRQAGVPSFRASQVTQFVPQTLQNDLQTIVSSLGSASRAHNIPLTFLLIPNREQIFGTAHFALQDSLIAMCRKEGIDWCDARDIFREAADKKTLFLPDWHFTPRGNQMLLAALRTHLEASPKEPPAR